MKHTKRVLTAILALLLWTLSGELYQSYLDSFEAKVYSIKISMPNSSQRSEVASDIQSALVHHNASAIIIKRSFTSQTTMQISVYGFGSDTPLILREMGISEGIAKSAMLGDSIVTIRPANEYRFDLELSTKLLLFGEDSDLQSFSNDLRSKYGVGVIKKEGAQEQSFAVLSIAWLALAAAICPLTAFECNATGKEHYLRFLFGTRPSPAKVAASDAAANLMLFALAYFLASRMTSSSFQLPLNLFYLAAFTLANAWIVMFSAKKSVYKIRAVGLSSSSLFDTSRLVKSLVILATCLAVVFNLRVISDAINHYRQADFFREHSEYDYKSIFLSLASPGNGEPAKTSQERAEYEVAFYRHFFNESLIQSILYSAGDYDAIYMNRNASGTLKGMFQDLDIAALKEKVYFFVPKRLEGMEIDYALLMYISIGDDSVESEVAYYSQDASVVSIHSAAHPYMSRLMDSPLIVFSNMDEQKMTSPEPFAYYQASNIMYSIPEDEIAEYFASTGFDPGFDTYISTNALSLYEYNRLYIGRLLLIGLVLNGMLIALAAIMAPFVIHISYSLNAKEVAVKKVMGQTLFGRNRSIFVPSMITYALFVLCLIAIWLLGDNYNNPLQLPEIAISLLCAVLIAAIETLATVRLVRKTDDMSTYRILKGETLQ